MDRLAGHDAGCLQFERTAAFGRDGAEAVDRGAERVDDATEVAIADGNGENLACAVHLHALNDSSELAEHDDADLIFVEVLGEAQRSVGELDELVGHHAGQTRNVGNSVAGCGDVTDLGRCGLVRLVGLDEVLESVADLIGADR